ncbi:hypothetical protein NDU88_002396 [Pleurodeles waltl]|uniref:Uncharacterized protein n=1 Tax=Pleurodeles waltl TaxID=8319 RepID=A0AAV7Q8Q9_PLEWA|nr:hypothetical protein NDU88_002396 [Pleurodeles waltl]
MCVPPTSEPASVGCQIPADRHLSLLALSAGRASAPANLEAREAESPSSGTCHYWVRQARAAPGRRAADRRSGLSWGYREPGCQGEELGI